MHVTEDRLLSTLRGGKPMTRQELVEVTGLSLATVNRALARMRADGTVDVFGRETSTGGRPPELYCYNSDGQVIVGVSITDAGVTALVLLRNGEVVSRCEAMFTRGDAPEDCLQRTLNLLERNIATPPGPVGAIGVAVPGVVTGSEGTVSAIHEMGWDQLALGDLLSRRVGMPVTLSNDADCLATAEHRRGAGRGSDNLVALVARNGLGAGLITNGHLYRGLHHEAGEIGYLLTGRESLGRLFPDRGDLEQLMGTTRLHREASRLGLPDPANLDLPGIIGLGCGASSGPLRDLADELLDLTALAVAALCVVLDPQIVIIGGSPDEAGMGSMIGGVRERLVGRILRVPPIEPAALGVDAITVGAALLAANARR